MNKKLENFCKEFGYDVNGQVGYGIVNGYEVNIYLEQDYSYPVRVHISTFITDEQKSRVKAELDAKNIKRLNVSFDRYGLVLGLNDTTMGKLMTRLNDIIKGAIETLKNAEALDFEYCPVCAMKFDETNKKCCVINGVRITLDNECISEIESRNKEFDSQPNNILKGLGGALIGALVGAIITFILFLLGYVATISGIVAVWLGCFLYKKFGGKANAYMYAIVSGVRAFTRTMEVLKWAVLVGFIACLAFSLFTDLSMPFFFVSTPNEFFTSIYSHIFSFGDYIFLFIIIDKIQIKKGEEKQLYLYSLIGMLLILALFFLFYAKYQVTAFMHNNALADILVFSVQFNAIGRLDIIAMLTIMFITLFQLEIYAYAFCDCFLNVFPKLSKIYSVVVFDVIFGILYYVFIGKYEILVGSSQVWSPWLGLFVNYIFPVICLIIILVTRRKKHERTS